MFNSKMTNNNIELKSNDKANEARITGNKHFYAKDFLYALNHYNRSISFAKTRNVAGLAYGNRSAAYFELQLYEECLENIQLARDNEYPATKMAKLDEREAKCKELMHESKDKKTDELWDFFKLSYPPNEKIPFVVDCVEMKWTKKYGRGIYATQDLKAGDVICVEDPFFTYTNKENKYNNYFQCYNCFNPNRMNLIPCDKIASIMFCSTACKEDFYSKTIDMEEAHCPGSKLLFHVAKHFGGVKAFDDYMKRTNLKTLNKTIFDYDLSNPEDPGYKDKLVNCFLSLSTNNNHTEDPPICLSAHVSKKTANHLLSIFELNERELRFEDGQLQMSEIGNHISLFSSLINHSCINNAFSINVGNKIVTFLEKPVKAGEQIFYRYGDQCWLMVYGFEKGKVEAIHHFKCDCDACGDQKDLIYSQFTKGAGMNDGQVMIDMDSIHRGQNEAAKKKLKKYFDHMNKYPESHKFYSSYLMWCQETLKSAAYWINYPICPHNILQYL